MSDSAEYTLRWRGRVFGPLSLAEINRQLDEHELGMGHEIQYHDAWITLEEFFVKLKEAAPAATTTQKPSLPRPATGPSPLAASVQGILPPEASPPPLPGSTPAAPAPPAHSVSMAAYRKPEVRAAPAEPQPAPEIATRPPRRRMIYALLGIFLGFLGLHNFYARNWLTGLLQLLLSCATYLLGFGIIVPWLWALLEAVLVRQDGDEIEMI